MATFIGLLNFTEQGVSRFRDTRKRATAFQEMARKAGVNVKEVYWTLGQYDGVVIVEAPDDESATGVLLNLAAQGNVRTQTLRAFNASEMEGVLSRAGGGARGGGGGGGRGGKRS
jgi:uncharacterized protein with GYD domain